MLDDFSQIIMLSSHHPNKYSAFLNGTCTEPGVIYSFLLVTVDLHQILLSSWASLKRSSIIAVSLFFLADDPTGYSFSSNKDFVLVSALFIYSCSGSAGVTSSS